MVLLVAAVFAVAILAACGQQTDSEFLQSQSTGTHFDLYAGQDILVGELIVESDSITFSTSDGWELAETHLAVSDDEPGDGEWTTNGWQNSKGNPAPGQFPNSMVHDPTVTEFTYDVAPKDFIAAHAVVVKYASPFADAVLDSMQGDRKNGTAVNADRSIPEAALVQDYPTSTVDGSIGFFSLGFGGWVEVSFECGVINGDGNDLRLWEATFAPYPSETAEVYAWDGTDWVLLGTADNSQPGPPGSSEALTVSEFDLGILTSTDRIRIVDTSNPALHNSAADGFDLDGIEALQACVEQEETAWAADGDGGQRFVERGNWATFIEYTAP